MGRKSDHTPNDETRASVRALASFGTPQEDIARYHRISRSTLRRLYADELVTAAVSANAQVAQTLFRQANGAPAEVDPGTGKVIRAEVKPNVTAAIFWLKARAGWVETTAVQHSGPEGGDVKVVLSGPLAGV